MVIKSFLFGGLLCVLAQILIDKTKITPARILTAYVCIGVILTGFGLYKPFVDFAGCGATVPLTGFGYLLAKGTLESVRDQGVLGALTGGLTAASAGICAAMLFSLSAGLLFPGKPNNL